METPICDVCRRTMLNTRLERSRGLCDGCAAHTGLWLEPPQLRPTRPCQRCGGTQFVASQLRDRGASQGRSFVAPLSLAIATGPQYFTPEMTAPWAPMGILVAFACRACGLTELYTLEADKILIGPEHGTYLVDYAPTDGPLR